MLKELFPGADLAVELWAGGELTPLEPDLLDTMSGSDADGSAPSLFDTVDQ